MSENGAQTLETAKQTVTMTAAPVSPTHQGHIQMQQTYTSGGDDFGKLTHYNLRFMRHTGNDCS